MQNFQENQNTFQPRRSWWNRNWKWFVPTGCFTLILLGVAFVVAIFYTASNVLTGSQPHKDAMEKVENNQRVIEILGEPIEAGKLFQGSIQLNNNDGTADITIPLSGPNGEGSVEVYGTKTDGVWTYELMQFESDSGESIDLLKE